MVALAMLSPAWGAAPAMQKVPFVGCKSDGQIGPMDAPGDNGGGLLAPASVAPFLDYYKAENGFGVLAPRGWYCFGYYGSNGTFLVVSPAPEAGKDALQNGRDDFRGMSGPAIQISFSDSETSGRFEVATTAARLFPAYKSFVERVIAEGLEPADDFPFGPYPDDILTRYSDRDVGFETPGHKTGVGTDSHLQVNGDPIFGEAIIGDGGLALIDVRLPRELRYLTPDIFAASRPVLLDAISKPD